MSLRFPDFDAIVVGAGPGGACAALALAQARLKVALIEKARLPRYKTCGGGLLQRTLRHLPADLLPVVEKECRTAALYHHGPSYEASCTRDRPIVSMVMRDRFDASLARAAVSAGATLFEGEPVLDVASEQDGVVVRTGAQSLRGRYVIGADGALSIVARRCGFSELTHVIPALEAEITVDAARFPRFEGAARFDFGLAPYGYGWVFPKKQHLSVGVLTTRKGSCNLHEAYARYLAEVGLSQPESEDKHGFMIPLRPRRGLFAHPRILLVGDAAGLADPVIAEGISEAVVSGQLAAQAIVETRSRKTGAVERYSTLLKAELLPELRAARLLAYFLYQQPRVRSWVFRKHGHTLAEYMVRVVAGETTYRAALGRVDSYARLLFR